VGTLFLAFVVSEHYTNKARDHLLAGELEHFAEDVTLANKIGFDGNYRAYLLAVNVPLTLLETPEKFNDDQLKDIFDQGLSYLQQVRQINPRSSSALFYLAKIQQLAPQKLIPEDLKSPEEYYQEALIIDPLHLGSRLELAQIYEGQQQNDKALALLEAGFDFRYGSAKAMELYGKLMQLYLINGNVGGQAKALHHLQQFQKRIIKDEEKAAFSVRQHLFGGQGE
jgi:tetratricopeptide (TPR) repeat protein